MKNKQEFEHKINLTLEQLKEQHSRYMTRCSQVKEVY